MTAAPAKKKSPPFPWLKPALFVGCLAPIFEIILRAVTNNLSADPVAFVLNRFGHVALIMLLLSLVLTPLKFVTGWTWTVRIRRELGLFAFFYACCHFLTYLLLDQGFDVKAILEDIGKRPFITVGFLALVLMTPLAVTSTDAMVRRLGYNRWKLLHRLVYVCGMLAVLHFIWRVKRDISEPAVYALVLAMLFALRIIETVRDRQKKARRAAA